MGKAVSIPTQFVRSGNEALERLLPPFRVAWRKAINQVQIELLDLDQKVMIGVISQGTRRPIISLGVENKPANLAKAILKPLEGDHKFPKLAVYRIDVHMLTNAPLSAPYHATMLG